MVLLRENLERGGLSMRDLVGSLYYPGNTHQPDKKLINVRRGEGGGERRGGTLLSPPSFFFFFLCRGQQLNPPPQLPSTHTPYPHINPPTPRSRYPPPVYTSSSV